MVGSYVDCLYVGKDCDGGEGCGWDGECWGGYDGKVCWEEYLGVFCWYDGGWVGVFLVVEDGWEDCCLEVFLGGKLEGMGWVG